MQCGLKGEREEVEGRNKDHWQINGPWVEKESRPLPGLLLLSYRTVQWARKSIHVSWVVAVPIIIIIIKSQRVEEEEEDQMNAPTRNGWKTFQIIAEPFWGTHPHTHTRVHLDNPMTGTQLQEMKKKKLERFKTEKSKLIVRSGHVPSAERGYMAL